MRIVKTIVAICFSVLVWSSAVAVTLNATIDRKQIKLGETITLTVSIDQQVSDTLSLDALKKDFQIFGTSRRSQIEIINGKKQTLSEWRINLLAKHQGTLTIPTLKLGQFSTQPIRVKVSPAAQMATTDNLTNQDADIFMKVSTSPEKPMVDSQLIYTLKLYYAKSIHNESLQPPMVSDVMMERLGEPHQYDTQVQERTYQVFEQRFIVFPDKPGKLSFQAPILLGVVEETAQPANSLGDFLVRRFAKPIRIVGRSIDVTVLPKPHNAPIKWLPTTSLVLKEHWSESSKTWRVGQPYTRTIDLSATGLKAQQLPVVNAATSLPGINDYPDKASLKNAVTPLGIVGRRLEKIAYIPAKPGDYQLPAITLKWWNLKTKRFVTAKLPARQVHVIPNENDVITPPTIDKQTHQMEPVVNHQLSHQTPSQPANVQPNHKHVLMPWVYLALLFAILIIIVLMFLLYRQSRTNQRIKPNDGGLSEKRLRAELKKACYANDAKAAGVALLNWGRSAHPQCPLYSISDLKRLFKDDEVIESLRALDKVLYTSGTTFWDGVAFWQVFSEGLKNITSHSQSKSKQREDLPTLNPKEKE